MKRISTSLLVIALVSNLFGYQSQPTKLPSSPVPPKETTTGTCQLVVLNGTGKMLSNSDMTVYEHDKEFVTLPRMTYRKLTIPAGKHEFRYFKGGWGSRGLAVLDAKPGEKYFLYVEYNPGKSWASPFGGRPERIQIITEADATTHMKTMQPIE
ncbi:MAG: hypothetical protein IPQ13_04290 [Holophagaceae bacterium]|nr:hypothetical protein [Holophagaceae bacterium]